MPMPVLAVKSFESSTNALAGSHAAQHSVIVLPCAGAVIAPLPSAAPRAPPATRSAFIVFMRISLHLSRPSTWRGVPARSNASSSATQSDVEEVEANFLAPIRILGDPAKLDLFSKSRFTKHGKWAVERFFENTVFACRWLGDPDRPGVVSRRR